MEDSVVADCSCSGSRGGTPAHDADVPYLTAHDADVPYLIAHDADVPYLIAHDADVPYFTAHDVDVPYFTAHDADVPDTVRGGQLVMMGVGRQAGGGGLMTRADDQG